MNTAVEAYAEKIVRDEWQNKLQDHGNSKCPECGHSGWTHGQRGCVAFRADTPRRFSTDFKTEVVDIPDGERLEDYYCGCKSGLCKTNEQIIFGHDLPEVKNEPLDKPWEPPYERRYLNTMPTLLHEE